MVGYSLTKVIQRWHPTGLSVAAARFTARSMTPNCDASWQSGRRIQRRRSPCKPAGLGTRHAKYVTLQLAEVVVPRLLFASILERIGRLKNSPALCPSG